MLGKEELELIDSIMSMGNQVLYRELPTKFQSSILLQPLIEKGILGARLRPKVKCPRCSADMNLRLNISYICEGCGNQIDIDENLSRDVNSQFHVDSSQLAHELRRQFENFGFNLVGEIQRTLQGVVDVGRLTDSSRELTYRILVNMNPIDKDSLYAIIGSSVLEEAHVLLLHVSPANGLDVSTVLELVFPLVLNVRLSSFCHEDTKERISNYIQVSESLHRVAMPVSDALGTTQDFTLSSMELAFFDDAVQLSQVGGARFEPVVVRLLQTLGVTSRLRQTGYVPDGMLYLPGFFYEIDAKSTRTHFKFRISERDKFRRYISQLREHASWFGEYQFVGLIIVTPELPDKGASSLKKVVTDFEGMQVQGKLVVIAFEGLLELYRLAFNHPEYWHRLNRRQHSCTLLDNPKRLLGNEYEIDSYSDRGIYLDTASMVSFFNQVMASPAPSLDGRDKRTLDDYVQSACDPRNR